MPKKRNGISSQFEKWGSKSESEGQPPVTPPPEQVDPDGRIPYERMRELEDRIDAIGDVANKLEFLNQKLDRLNKPANGVGSDPFAGQNFPFLEAGRNIRLDKVGRRIRISHLSEDFDTSGSHIPPLFPMDQGELGVIFKELVFGAKDDLQAWDGAISVGGGSATTLADNTTNYCWLEYSYTRFTLSGIYQWGLTGITLTVNTTAAYQPAGYNNKVETHSSCIRVQKFAEITTASGDITGIDYIEIHPFVDSACALAGTPLYDSTELDDLISGTTTNDILYWNQSTGAWVVLSAPSTSGSFYLKVESGTLKWQAAGSC